VVGLRKSGVEVSVFRCAETLPEDGASFPYLFTLSTRCRTSLPVTAVTHAQHKWRLARCFHHMGDLLHHDWHSPLLLADRAVLEKMGAKVQAHNEGVPVVDRDTWHLADGIIFGSGSTRFGMMTSCECSGGCCGGSEWLICAQADVSALYL
jgi:hypothetical protein